MDCMLSRKVDKALVPISQKLLNESDFDISTGGEEDDNDNLDE